MRVWLARDKNGDLSFFDRKPSRKKNFFLPTTEKMKPLSWFVLPKDEYPEVTWENSPKEYDLEFKLTPIEKGGEIMLVASLASCDSGREKTTSGNIIHSESCPCKKGGNDGN